MKRKVYLDLDTLLDTRLGTIASVHPEAAKAIATNDEYWLREHTNWSTLSGGLIDNEQFDAAWQARDKRALENSYVSNIIPVLHSILTEYHVSTRDHFIEYDLVLEINIHPYNLTEEEMDELADVLRHDIFYKDLEILYCSIPMEELTPQLINERYSAMLLYEFHKWIKQHYLEVAKCDNRGLTMIVPKLFEKDPSKLTVEKKQEEIIGFKLWFLDRIEVKFIDAKCFSMLRVSPKDVAVSE